MAEIFRFFGLIFFFYSNEPLHEPLHVHVKKGGYVAKFYFDPVRCVRNSGLSAKDLKKAQRIINDNRNVIIKAWNEVHG